MSLYDYKKSQEIWKSNYPFESIIMAAMRQADSINLENLKNSFPEIYEEFYKRYNSPGGILNDDELEEYNKDYININKGNPDNTI